MKYGEMIEALEQRGVRDANSVLFALSEEQVDNVPAIIKWWDNEPTFGTGMLVKQVKTGKVPAPAPLQNKKLPITPVLLQAVKGTCESPDGIERDEVRSLFAFAAKKRGLTADELIDRAMGAEWEGTPAA